MREEDVFGDESEVDEVQTMSATRRAAEELFAKREGDETK